MRRGAGARATLGLAATAPLVALLAPRSLPRVDLLDPAARTAEITEFGLRALAALLAGYLALVFACLLLATVHLLPASGRALVERWTSRGLAGGLRRCIGLSALAIGVLPLQPLAAHATESAPVLAPDDAGPPRTAAPRLEPRPPATAPTAAPRLEPIRPAPPSPAAPGPEGSQSPVAQPEAEPVIPTPGPLPTPPSRPREITVGDGDSFWTVAERLTSARLGRPAGDGEVLEPWLALIEANRDRLTDPGDPGLLFPGQVLRLPE